MYRFAPYFFLLLSTGTAQIDITLSEEPLPVSVDNHTTPHFPPVISQMGESCGNANGIGYVFNYEMNAARGLPVEDSVNYYSYFATYNHLNDGSSSNGTYTMFLDAWCMVRDNGIMNIADFGEHNRATKWASGYDAYYRGMHNRVAAIDSLSFLEEGTLESMKQWLFDHGDSSPTGGIFTFTASAYSTQPVQISEGPEIDKYIMDVFGTSTETGPHDFGVVGYNDSILYDFNGDGEITNDLDLNDDGSLDIADLETGAFLCVNSWGGTYLDEGFFYAPYRLFATPLEEGGTITNKAYFIKVSEDYTPSRTLRISLFHEERNMLSLSVGISEDSAAATPSHTRLLRQFDHAGGAYPMQGRNADPDIEIGIDVSDLIDSISGNGTAAYFLIIDADDDNGRCDSVSLIDYTTSIPVEYPAASSTGELVEGRNTFRIPLPHLQVRSPLPQRRDLTALFVRRSGRQLRISVFFPFFRKAELYSCDGRRIQVWDRVSTGGYLVLPGGLRPGMYVLAVVRRDGSREVVRVDVAD